MLSKRAEKAISLLSHFAKEIEPVVKNKFMTGGDKGITHDFLMWPFRKLIGKQRFDEAAWKYVGRPLAKADVALGEQLMGKGNLFKRTAERELGGGKYEKVLIPSATKPLKEVQSFGVPLLASMYLAEKMNQSPQPQGDIE